MSPISSSEIMINKDFPADHPYSSHISRYAVFPTFQSPEDAKRGVQARREQPINAEMPATAYDVQIIHKTKGIPNLTSKLRIVNVWGVYSLFEEHHFTYMYLLFMNILRRYHSNCLYMPGS